jgi:hypothetical protein
MMQEISIFNVLNDFGIAMKLVRVIKMYSNEICNEGYIGKHLFDAFFNQNGLEQGDSVTAALQICSSTPLGKFKKDRRNWS